MCVDYVHYYAVAALEVFKSSVDTRSLNDFFAFMNWIIVTEHVFVFMGSSLTERYIIGND
ncbi:hypothetical protein DPMN_089353 [Dreissena polymorpha]|uniref:Uncharacterized protein n=1 Tax=Dreissena polymorpha TaxID=45954 RepID=A0A9D4KW89_DREPO|nr:hypothetical protein DPMN_089353 [Dreissena polymorpha]